MVAERTSYSANREPESDDIISFNCYFDGRPELIYYPDKTAFVVFLYDTEGNIANINPIIDTLINIISTEANPVRRRAAVHVLGIINTPKAAEALIAFISSGTEGESIVKKAADDALKAIDVTKFPEYEFFVADQRFFDRFDGGAHSAGKGAHLPGGLIILNGERLSSSIEVEIDSPVVTELNKITITEKSREFTIISDFDITGFKPADFKVISVSHRGRTTRYIVAQDEEGYLHIWHTDGTKVTGTLRNEKGRAISTIDKFAPDEVTDIRLGLGEYTGYITDDGEITMLNLLEFQATLLHEFTHSFLLTLKNENADLYKKLWDATGIVDEPEFLQRIAELVENAYRGEELNSALWENKDVRAFIGRLGLRLAEAGLDLFPAWFDVLLSEESEGTVVDKILDGWLEREPELGLESIKDELKEIGEIAYDLGGENKGRVILEIVRMLKAGYIVKDDVKAFLLPIARIIRESSNAYELKDQGGPNNFVYDFVNEAKLILKDNVLSKDEMVAHLLLIAEHAGTSTGKAFRSIRLMISDPHVDITKNDIETHLLPIAKYAGESTGEAFEQIRDMLDEDDEYLITKADIKRYLLPIAKYAGESTGEAFKHIGDMLDEESITRADIETYLLRIAEHAGKSTGKAFASIRGHKITKRDITTYLLPIAEYAGISTGKALYHIHFLLGDRLSKKEITSHLLPIAKHAGVSTGEAIEYIDRMFTAGVITKPDIITPLHLISQHARLSTGRAFEYIFEMHRQNFITTDDIRTYLSPIALTAGEATGKALGGIYNMFREGAINKADLPLVANIYTRDGLRQELDNLKSQLASPADRDSAVALLGDIKLPREISPPIFSQ
jgi:hypothetical protein